MGVSLGEGNTPLIEAPRLSGRLGCEIWLKLESMNPTGSFKDRGMTVAVSRALEGGARGVVCASTGNTAASAAAYAARAGLRAVILHPAGAVAAGKLVQARAVGAELRPIDGSFEDAHALARRLAEEEGLVNVNSINPDRIEGQSTAAHEIISQLDGRTLDVLALPYGGGGNTVAYARGFTEAGTGLPRLLLGEAGERSRTFASAIRIAEPVHSAEVGVAVGRSEGAVVSLSEEQIARAWRALAHEEGVFCEPASAAGLAAVEAGRLDAGTRVVCVVTGHGLKDPDAVERS
jgi:threonine synthase